jgi:hypothetical protein
MPSVPRYQPNQVQEQITPRAQSNVQVTRAALGGGDSVANTFSAAGKLGGQAAEVELDARKRVSDDQFLNADLELSKLQIDTMVEVKKLKGINALQSEELIKKQWDEKSKELLGKYQDPITAKRVENAIKSRYDDIYRDSEFHISGELQKHEENTHKAYVDGARQEAIFNYKDPEKIKFNLEKQETVIRMMAEKQGWSPEQTKVEMDKAVSDTHLKIVQRRLNDGDDQDALKYFESVKSQLSGEDQSTAAKLLDDATLRGESQRTSDSIVKKSTDMVEALESAKNISDPKLRDETVTRVRQYYADKKAADNQSTSELHKRATDFIDKTPDIDAYMTQNPADWARFSLSERSQLKQYAAKARSGGDSETNFEVYYDLRNMASGNAEQRAQFAQINLADPKLLNNLGKADRERLVTLQTQMRQGKGQKALDGYRTANAIVNDELKAAGINPNAKKGSKDAERVAMFRARVDEEINKIQDDTGKKVTNEQLQGIVTNLLTPAVVEKGFFFDTKKSVFEIEPGEEAVFKYDDIPKAKRIEIESLMRKVGETITEESVVQYWIDQAGINKSGR